MFFLGLRSGETEVLAVNMRTTTNHGTCTTTIITRKRYWYCQQVGNGIQGGGTKESLYSQLLVSTFSAQHFRLLEGMQ